MFHMINSCSLISFLCLIEIFYFKTVHITFQTFFTGQLDNKPKLINKQILQHGKEIIHMENATMGKVKFKEKEIIHNCFFFKISSFILETCKPKYHKG